MLQAILLASSLFFCGTQAYQGEDMDDDDFATFVRLHDNVGQKYGESAGKGCVTGAIGAAPAGFQALCIGCTLGAAGNVASDMFFPENERRRDR